MVAKACRRLKSRSSFLAGIYTSRFCRDFYRYGSGYAGALTHDR
jgi:hypothetical protein